MKIDASALNKLSKSLSRLEDKIVLTSNKDIDERLHALSEIRYYKKITQTFNSLKDPDRASVVTDLVGTLEEMEKWFYESA